MSWWPWNWGKNASDNLMELFKEYAPLATLIAAPIPLFFVGLFASVGTLDYFLLIDRGSMLTSLLYYTALLSLITAIVLFVPSLVMPNRDALQWLARAVALVLFLLAVIGVEYTVMLALPGASIFLFAWLKWRRAVPNDASWLDWLLGRPSQPASDWRLLLRRLLPVVLVCCPVLGYLRGEYLRDQKPSMIVQLGDSQKTKHVTIIMSFDKGMLVFEPASPHAQFYPWGRIAGIGPAWNWRDAVRRWIGLGVDIGPQAKER